MKESITYDITLYVVISRKKDQQFLTKQKRSKDEIPTFLMIFLNTLKYSNQSSKKLPMTFQCTHNSISKQIFDFSLRLDFQSG